MRKAETGNVQDNRRRTRLAVRVSARAGITGCRQGSSPSIFFFVEHDVRKVMHGDDFAIEGPRSGVVHIQKGLGARYKTKNQLIGPLKEDAKELTMLNRVVKWMRQGVEYCIGQRHSHKLSQ